ncbi:MAG: MBL fold metallo-hydrolase [Christensenellales bacterium]|jgi:L-ascorbate metabolism protein UlaG (beta-lactamase superfamily)
MKLIWHGHSCFEMDFAGGPRVIADPFDEKVGYPLCTAQADIVTNSHAHMDHNYNASVGGDFTRLNRAGTFAFSDITITAVPSFHDDAGGAKRGANLLFLYEAEGLKIAHLGDLGHMPDDAQFAALENADVMLLPIGGYYTIDTPTALSLIARAKPRVAVAMHFKTPAMDFPISDERAFAAATGAHYPRAREIEITRANLHSLPAAIILDPPQ